MNRREILKFGGAAGLTMVAGRVVAGSPFSRPTLHPAIQANIDYWIKACPDWLAECPPRHTSYYAVKEADGLRVYAVKWNGSDLNDHVLTIPVNEDRLIAEVKEEIRRASKSTRQGMDIGDTVMVSDGSPMKFCSYVYDSPLRRIKRWGGSFSTSLLARNKFFKFNKDSE